MKGKKILIRFLVLLLAVQGAVAAQLLFLPSARADSTPEVVINEIMWMGSSLSTADEWIELYNPTDREIDIGGWFLTGVDSGGNLVIPKGKKIASRGFFLISNFDKSDDTILDIKPDLYTTRLQLLNNCPEGTTTFTRLIKPVEGVMPSLVFVDKVGCKSNGHHLAGERPDIGGQARSMERKLTLGDGTDIESWQTSNGFVNLKIGSWPVHRATPGFANHQTGPTGGNVYDGTTQGVDIDWTNLSTLSFNWGGFVDEKVGLLDEYFIGIGTTPGTDNVMSFRRTSATSHDFFDSALSEGVKYYASVAAFNEAGVMSKFVTSDGQQINTSDPAEPTNGVGEDVPDDSGGSVSLTWDASVSLDVINYEIFQRLAGETTWTKLETTSANTLIVSNLINEQAYEFAVSSVDFNNQKSDPEKLIITATALDNLAPILASEKVTVGQNFPGTSDTISGVAGSVNEPVTVNVFDRNPSLPGAILLGAVGSLSDGSFPAIGIGDNLHSVVWIQLIDKDATSLSSVAVSFNNDIVGPNSPTLERLIANCEGQTSCRVEISWRDNGPDSVNFIVSYTTGGVERRTTPQAETTLILDLENDRSYDFVVYALDRFGNISERSNLFFVSLNRGVRTDVTVVDGQQVTEVSAILASTALSQDPIPEPISQPTLIPEAEAQEPTPQQPQEEAETRAAGQDWVRIFSILILLLIIAFGLYMLSRSFRGGKNLNTPPPQPERTVPPVVKDKKKNGKNKKR